MVDKLTWSWKKAMRGLGIGLVVGLGVGLIVKPLSTGLGGLVVSLGFGLLGALLSGLNAEQIEETTHAGQRLRQTFYNSIMATLASGSIIVLVSGLLFGLRGLSLGLFIGLLAGLLLGGRALIQHYLVRYLLICRGLLPRRLIPFLDYAVDLIFLRRVGGGYIFVHRLLMEHFAEMKI